MLARAILIWLLIALAEVAQGTMRVKLLNPRVGDHRARQIAVFTGSGLIFLITWLTFGWIGIWTETQAIGVGAMWVMLMTGLEIGFGRWVFHLKWRKILEDFDLRRGRLLVLGMVILLLSPWLVGKMKVLW